MLIKRALRTSQAFTKNRGPSVVLHSLWIAATQLDVLVIGEGFELIWKNEPNKQTNSTTPTSCDFHTLTPSSKC